MNIRQHFAIFDLDGTLANSMLYWDMVCGEFLREQEIKEEGLLEVMKPMTLAQSAEYLRQNYGCTFSFTEMYIRMCELMREHYAHDVCAKPGVHAFLDRLSAQGVRMCLASSSPVDLVLTCLDALHLRQYFDWIVSAEEVGKGKTEPDIYLEAARKLNAEVTDTLVFEDALTAGMTAKRAGFTVVAVYDETGKAEWEEFKRAADFVIENWEDA